MVLDGDTSSAHHSQQGQEAGPGDPPRELLQGQKAAEELLLAARWAPICLIIAPVPGAKWKKTTKKRWSIGERKLKLTLCHRSSAKDVWGDPWCLTWKH